MLVNVMRHSRSIHFLGGNSWPFLLSVEPSVSGIGRRCRSSKFNTWIAGTSSILTLQFSLTISLAISVSVICEGEGIEADGLIQMQSRIWAWCPVKSSLKAWIRYWIPRQHLFAVMFIIFRLGALNWRCGCRWAPSNSQQPGLWVCAADAARWRRLLGRHRCLHVAFQCINSECWWPCCFEFRIKLPGHCFWWASCTLMAA